MIGPAIKDANYNSKIYNLSCSIVGMSVMPDALRFRDEIVWLNLNFN